MMTMVKQMLMRMRLIVITSGDGDEDNDDEDSMAGMCAANLQRGMVKQRPSKRSHKEGLALP